jgi:hypothetical protein
MGESRSVIMAANIGSTAMTSPSVSVSAENSHQTAIAIIATRSRVLRNRRQQIRVADKQPAAVCLLPQDGQRVTCASGRRAASGVIVTSMWLRR